MALGLEEQKVDQLKEHMEKVLKANRDTQEKF